MTNSGKVIAIYFPQFHTIPENDEWWGKGFTDWDMVRRARPMFPGHHQPRVPLESNYYDQSKLEILRWQVDLAKRYGIHGFCHYHYWFDGRKLLETPTELFLEHKELDMPFCLSWANETWSRRWDGRDDEILIRQTHPPTEASWQRHFDYLVRFWMDERAIRVDGKPVFVIYRPQRIPQVGRMLDFWRRKAEAAGLPGLFFIAQKQYEHPKRSALDGFDAEFQFQPFEAVYSPGFSSKSVRASRWFRWVRALPEGIQDRLRAMKARRRRALTFYDYDEVWEQIVRVREDARLITFPGAFADWDNTAR
ncbi:hypothetical protein D6779_01520, partial [Candidatus Parcubacteria bacterium]